MVTPLLAELKPHHVSIAVTDMDLAIDWYRSVLGFAVERRFHAAGIPADGAFLRRPELRLELWCAAGVKPVPAERQVPDSDLRTAGTKHVAFTNYCDITVRENDGWIILISVLDNLIKGASGAAVQCLNVMFDFDQAEGLRA